MSDKKFVCSHPLCDEKFIKEKLVNGNTPDHNYSAYEGIGLVRKPCPFSRRKPEKL